MKEDFNSHLPILINHLTIVFVLSLGLTFYFHLYYIHIVKILLMNERLLFDKRVHYTEIICSIIMVVLSI